MYRAPVDAGEGPAVGIAARLPTDESLLSMACGQWSVGHGEAWRSPWRIYSSRNQGSSQGSVGLVGDAPAFSMEAQP